ncbi:hypothetical protein M3197_02955 [Sporosarcina aquimarina]|uniref:hypothetical protein n=1 Tax=Sporosarcina aquimarina TaxID=114975 RepID=UPI00203DAA66|nr:hypothetical protein [Sporosarcina aquimarina]MCM3756436.1 hypothetical protein [Sporosarcina aquimarina]
MKLIRISLIINKLVFEGDFPQNNDLINEWAFSSETVNKSSLTNLYNKAIDPSRIGWSSYEIVVTASETRIEIRPTFFVDSTDDKYRETEKILIRAIENEIEKFVYDNEAKSIEFNLDEKSDDNDYNVFIYSCPGASDSNEFRDFISELEQDTISYKIEYERSQVTDQGASGGIYEVLLYIVDTITAGVVYDLIKKMPEFKIITNLKKSRIENFKKKAALCLNTLPGNLELNEINEISNGNKNMQVTFRFNRNYYDFVFDNDNEIIHFIQKQDG